MRWPWSRPRRRSEGEAARIAASTHYAEARDQWPVVHAVADSLRELRERNHFAESIEAVFRGERR